MKGSIARGPHETLLFRAIAFFSRIRLSYLHRSTGERRWPLLLFVLVTGSIALGTISLAAWLTKLPLLFPPLGPSAFILFSTPMSEQASPRSVFVSHAMGVAAGFASLWILNAIFPDAGLLTGTGIGLPRILATALAMSLIGVGMMGMNTPHPPAAATTLIVATGYLTRPEHVLGLMAAVTLLLLEAIFFIRLQAGLPYPFWRSDPDVSRSYGSLAGISRSGATFWQRLTVSSVFSGRRGEEYLEGEGENP